MKQVKESQEEVELLQQEKVLIYELVNNLLCGRLPSPSYPLYMQEKNYIFQLKALKERKPYKTMKIQVFLGTFQSSNFLEKNLLCELYFHDLACLEINLVTLCGRCVIKGFCILCLKSGRLKVCT